MEAYNDSSPLSLAVDDTALAPKLRTVWNPDSKTWSLLGHVNSANGTSVGSELSFAEDDDLKATLKKNKLTRRKKVRKHCSKTEARVT